MNCDSYYEIGTNHEHCQDYIVHGQFEEYSYLIGSDGCSSSQHSDVGARLVCHTAKTRLIEMIIEKDFEKCTASDLQFKLQNGICSLLKVMKDLLSLQTTVLDATLNIVIVDSLSEQYWWFLWGDGAIILKESPIQGEIETTILMHNIEYPSNAPFYLSYRLDEERQKQYLKEFAPKEYNVSLKTFHKTSDNQIMIRNLPSDSGVSMNSNINNLLTISICSDGILTYNSIDKMQISKNMLAYKNLVGEFVQRRMLKLKKENLKNSITHYDDIYFGTINLQR